MLAIGQLGQPGVRVHGENNEYFATCMSLIDMFLEELSSEQARATLMASIYLYELNMKTSSWIWLSSSIRITQCLGLNQETESWTGLEGEMRRRLWWAVYVLDRSVRSSRMMMIVGLQEID